jgi:membrane protein YqaA with SNARE-associated domain
VTVRRKSIRHKTPWQALVAMATVTVVGGVIGGVWNYYCGPYGLFFTVPGTFFLGAVGGHLIARRWPQRLEVTP